MSSYSALSKTQLKEIREAFNIFDKDKSGSISTIEMKNVIKALGIKATDSEIQQIMRQMDVDGDGEVSFEEFAKIMGAQFYRNYTTEEIKSAFRYFDKDNNGYISKDELKSVMSKMGKKYTDNEINKMVKSIDTDGNGMISIEEFVQLLN